MNSILTSCIVHRIENVTVDPLALWESYIDNREAVSHMVDRESLIQKLQYSESVMSR